MKPRRIHNLLSKLPRHLFMYPYVFQKTHIFPLTWDYSAPTCLNISAHFYYTLYIYFEKIILC
jgi:hypothetical protein